MTYKRRKFKMLVCEKDHKHNDDCVDTYYWQCWYNRWIDDHIKIYKKEWSYIVSIYLDVDKDDQGEYFGKIKYVRPRHIKRIIEYIVKRSEKIKIIYNYKNINYSEIL